MGGAIMPCARLEGPAPQQPVRIDSIVMDLLEYQGKQLFARHGVPVPSGKPATTVDEAVAAADEIGYPCVVKAQVLIGGRGQARGLKVAKDPGAARRHPPAVPRHDIPRPTR